MTPPCLMCGHRSVPIAPRCEKHLDAYLIWQMGGSDEVTFRGGEDEPLECEELAVRVHFT